MSNAAKKTQVHHEKLNPHVLQDFTYKLTNWVLEREDKRITRQVGTTY